MAIALKTFKLNSSNPNFRQSLQEVSDRLCSGQPIHLSVNEGCQPMQCSELSQWIKKIPPKSLSKLSLNCNNQLIESPEFLLLLEALKSNPPKVLALSFTEDELNDPAIEQQLIARCATIANFPVIITHAKTGRRISFKMFEDAMIKSIRANKQAANHGNAPITSTDELDIEEDPNALKIRLKSLIKPKGALNNEFNQYVEIDVEYTEVLEHAVEETVQVNVNAEQVMAQYQGELVDYTHFNAPRYQQIAKASAFKPEQIDAAFKLAEFELFANLPHAVKYLSPAAAERLAASLPQLVVFNKEHCASFVLKKTGNEEYVLDYELEDDNEDTYALSPHEFSPYEDKEPYYLIDFKQDTLANLIQNKAIEDLLKGANNLPLMNLWLSQGDAGIKLFFTNLNRLDTTHPGLSVFLYQHYFSHFDNLEPFYTHEFFDCLLKLSEYKPWQLNCLKRFLIQTGSSQHNLAKTLEGFDYFLSQFSALCGNDEGLMQQLDVDWLTPSGGQPVVYMERLLTLLKNARNVQSQLVNLTEITLDNYGAYYASNYEGFTHIHPSMQFDYQPQKLNQQPFNPAFQLYRIELDRLCEIANGAVKKLKRFSHTEKWKWAVLDGHKIHISDYMTSYDELPGYQLHSLNDDGSLDYKVGDTLPISTKRFYTHIHRFMGQQLQGISFPDFVEQFQKRRESIKKLSENGFSTRLAYVETNFSLPLQLLQSLFFITQERYKGVVDKQDESSKNQSTFTLLLEESESICIDNMLEEITRLKRLHSHNVKLNDEEIIYYAKMQTFSSEMLGVPKDRRQYLYEHRIAASRVAEAQFKNSQWWGGVIKEYPERLVTKLIANKYAVFKYINFVGSQKMASTYAFNTHDYFSEVSDIALTFPDDLLLFSTLLNNYELNIVKSDFINFMKSDEDDALALKKIREYLLLATEGELVTNSLNYAFKLLVDSQTCLSYAKVLDLFAKVSQLALKENELDVNAIHDLFKNHKIPIKTQVPAIFKRDNPTIKTYMNDIILGLELMEQGLSMQDLILPNRQTEEGVADKIKSFWEKRENELRLLPIKELQSLLQQLLLKAGTPKSILINSALKHLLSSLRSNLIESAFKERASLDENHFMAKWHSYTANLADLQEGGDFDKINRIADAAEAIAFPCAVIARHACVRQHESECLRLFDSVQFNRVNSELVAQWLTVFSNMPQRDYLPILKAMLGTNTLLYKHPDKFLKLALLVSKLNAHEMTTPAITNFCKLFSQFPPEHPDDYDVFIEQLLCAHFSDSSDPLVELFLGSESFTFNQILAISTDTQNIREHRGKLADFYKLLNKNKQLDNFLQLTNALAPDSKELIISILSIASSTKRLQDASVNLMDVAADLQALSFDNLKALHTQYASAPLSLACLGNALKTLKSTTPFNEFLESIEKSPFGKRDLEEQFSCREVERVINNSADLLNNSPYSYQYRKQLMETFLLVNEMGKSLPVFNGKSARELSNHEIKSFFTEFKENSNYTLTQKKLMSLSLMREAMYRSTGQFPYSTQMISIIDCMLHPGDVISNIDTGQGKSLIDVMKAAFLWLQNDRVEISTSSLVDAKRDIENYSPFLAMLGIPFATKPIFASTNFDEFCQNGINFSTFAQLRLFFSRALACDHSFSTKNEKISIVLNESDYSLLDDRAVKRFASSQGMNIAKKHSWIYDAINEYVGKSYFTSNNSSINTDIRRLRVHLKSQARILGKPHTIINHLTDDDLLVWIESALIVNYKFRENFDYVITEVEEELTHQQAKVLMNDARPSDDSVFGRGAHQLLHARLNKEKKAKTQSGEDAFAIKPENKTIISLNNRSLVDYYQRKNGVIWGSSGTVGSALEMKELYKKYGIEFSKIEPHQAKQVYENKLIVFPNKKTHYERLTQEVHARKIRNHQAPTLIFCENIEKANDIYKHLVKTTGKVNLQLFTGVGDEAATIQRAARPGMFTITTSAIGRNTDIAYDKKVGLDIWHTGINSTRIDYQKSGRTGRQGSPGKIYYFLNQEDQQIKSEKDIAALRANLDELARKEREYNEKFYIIIGHFLAEVEKIPSALFTVISKQEFIRLKWSIFSETEEQLYRELQLKQAFQQQSFIESAKKSLVQIIQEAAPEFDITQIKDITEKAYSEKPIYKPYTQNVTIADCIPPMTIAHEILYAHKNVGGEISEAEKKKIKGELQALFSKSNPSTALNNHVHFFRYIQATASKRKALRDIYQEFLNQFMANASQNNTLLGRWFGFNTPLTKIASDEHYLSLFRTLACIDKRQPILDASSITNIMVSLIEEYLQNSWFVSSEKRDAALKLQREILNSGGDINVAIQALVKSQLAIADMDLKSNQQRLIPVNFFRPNIGSRLQHTISKALVLAGSLGVRVNTDRLVKGLTGRLEAILEDNTQLGSKGDALDATKEIIDSPKATDVPNARVLARALENTLQLKKKHEETDLSGMQGRTSLCSV